MLEKLKLKMIIFILDYLIMLLYYFIFSIIKIMIIILDGGYYVKVSLA